MNLLPNLVKWSPDLVEFVNILPVVSADQRERIAHAFVHIGKPGRFHAQSPLLVLLEEPLAFFAQEPIEVGVDGFVADLFGLGAEHEKAGPVFTERPASHAKQKAKNILSNHMLNSLLINSFQVNLSQDKSAVFHKTLLDSELS